MKFFVKKVPFRKHELWTNKNNRLKKIFFLTNEKTERLKILQTNEMGRSPNNERTK